MTTPVGFGVLGANSYVANAAVLPAIAAADNARLVASASRSAPVPDRWSSTAVDDYDAVLRHPEVDAVYIPLPNGLHREWTERAAAFGKHVLCEKPLASDAATARQMVDACDVGGVLLAEAWMTPFDRRWSGAIERLRHGDAGTITSQHHRFTFTLGADAEDNYRWDPGQGGGALLDLGIYCVGTAVELWGTDCSIDWVSRSVAESGVDARTVAQLRWSNDRAAVIECSFLDAERQTASFRGSDGDIVLEHAAFTSGQRRSDQILRQRADGSTDVTHLAPGNPYQTMVEAFADAVSGTVEWPRPVERSIELLELLGRIAHTDSTP